MARAADHPPDLDRFFYERQMLRHGLRSVAGIDEAGRGPLAGPVVAAAVILPWSWVEHGLPSELIGLNDSKVLTAVQRDRFFGFLSSRAEVRFGVAFEEAEAIDHTNILQATHRAMERAVSLLQPDPDHLLVDGRPVPQLRLAQTAIVKGDAKSYSIAAASVLAKVTRDRLMLAYDRQWPQYGFADHKGYGTPQHLAALARHGPCPIHRKTFAPLRPEEMELF